MALEHAYLKGSAVYLHNVGVLFNIEVDCKLFHLLQGVLCCQSYTASTTNSCSNIFDL